ncbi:hypothetical protein PIB30_084065 [Stylosanthes scabra]|uniref:Uncharacterized protein n=1 Tax=Stylosanthes scabra TaxID=79078 RepID=A0ABU6YQ24_9FABA|nr:hypothetical protein [Stylosanthes scabra]
MTSSSSSHWSSDAYFLHLHFWTVLSVVSVMDIEMLEIFKKTHHLYMDEHYQSHYEIVPPSPDERVYYPNLNFPSEPHFLYVCECMFTRLGVKIPFFEFEQDILLDCKVTPSQLHPNSWAFMRGYQGSTEYNFPDFSEDEQPMVHMLKECLRLSGVPLDENDFDPESKLHSHRARYMEAYRRMKQRKKNILARQATTENLVINPDPPTPVVTTSSETNNKTLLVGFKAHPPPSSQVAKSSSTDKSTMDVSKRTKVPSSSFGSIFENEFDAAGFMDKYVIEGSRVATDDAIQKRVAKAPSNSSFEISQLKAWILTLESEKAETDGKIRAIQSEVAKYKKMIQGANETRAQVEKGLND